MSFEEFFSIYASVSESVRIEISKIVNNFLVEPSSLGIVAEYPDIFQSQIPQIPYDKLISGDDNYSLVAK